MRGFRIIVLVAAAVLVAHAALGQTAEERRQKLNNMIPKHEGYLGALAPENLNKKRPAPPFNPDANDSRLADHDGAAADRDLHGFQFQ